MIICHSKRFIFIHIQKAGGTSVELALEPFLAWSDLLLGSSKVGEELSRHYHVRFGLNKHSSLPDIERVCGNEICRNYYIFATVRHPLDRLCSLYNYVAATVHTWAERQRISLDELAVRASEQVPLDAPSLGWPASRAFLASSGFYEFIRHEELRRDPGFRTQVSRFRSRDDGLVCVHPFRLEEKSLWISQIKERLDLNFILSHDNKTPITLIRSTDVPHEDREYVSHLFKEDYDVLGYEV